MLALIWLGAILLALYLYIRQVQSGLSRRGVNHLPVVPFFGHMAPVLMRRTHFLDIMQKNYNNFPEDRIVGQYEFLHHTILIRDLELLKRVTVKDFDHFVDRRGFVDPDMDPLFGRNLLGLRGEEWKDMRSALSPAFTSSKIRLMVPLMVEVADEMMLILKNKVISSSGSYIEVEGKDLSQRFANDVIATCAFGVKISSKKHDNEFFLKSQELTLFKTVRLLKIFAFRCFPWLTKALKISLSSPSVQDFFRNLVLSNMQEREMRNIVRNDMIHLLIEAKKGNLSYELKGAKDTDAGFATVEESVIGRRENNRREWTDIDLVAQATLFLFAGFDTISTAMSFLIHELAVNPDVQEKLAQEIKESYEQNKGKIDYDTIQKMRYMDMVISEVLRKWPAAPFVDRRCVKDYNLGKPNNKSSNNFIIRKGESVTLPVWPIHRDPEFYPNPNKFDPERFSAYNKQNINPSAYEYFPFGIGPRNCIGQGLLSAR